MQMILVVPYNIWDMVSFNNHRQLWHLTCAGERDLSKPYTNELDSVKQAGEKCKLTWTFWWISWSTTDLLWDNLSVLKVSSKPFQTKMNPHKFPKKRNDRARAREAQEMWRGENKLSENFAFCASLKFRSHGLAWGTEGSIVLNT